VPSNTVLDSRHSYQNEMFDKSDEMIRGEGGRGGRGWGKEGTNLGTDGVSALSVHGLPKPIVPISFWPFPLELSPNPPDGRP
jgi:hypothetical protein